jgi:hypothetical protein
MQNRIEDDLSSPMCVLQQNQAFNFLPLICFKTARLQTVLRKPSDKKPSHFNIVIP